MAIKLKQEVGRRLLASLQRYCAENLDEAMGELKARLLLDICVREIGPPVYNQAVLDAQAAIRSPRSRRRATRPNSATGKNNRARIALVQTRKRRWSS